MNKIAKVDNVQKIFQVKEIAHGKPQTCERVEGWRMESKRDQPLTGGKAKT